jgi:alcohol dehydrogenase class IV
MGLDKVKNKGVPLVAVPTTSGTGSEVTIFTIITDTSTDVKMLIGGGLLMPQVAIADPLMTVSMPRALTAATGMDALCHAIEAYVSLKAHPLSDIFALSAIELLADNLRLAWANGNNLEAREKVMIGALKAGVAFTNSSVTLVHGMSRPIGANFHVPHGMSNAVLLTTVMEFSLIANPARFARVGEAMGLDACELSEMEAAKMGVEAVRSLVKDIQIPSMKDVGLEEAKLIEKAPKMAEAAIASGSPGNNPRQVTKEDIIELYSIAYNS